jgi:hypothetical protein
MDIDYKNKYLKYKKKYLDLKGGFPKDLFNKAKGAFKDAVKGTADEVKNVADRAQTKVLGAINDRTTTYYDKRATKAIERVAEAQSQKEKLGLKNIVYQKEADLKTAEKQLKDAKNMLTSIEMQYYNYKKNHEDCSKKITLTNDTYNNIAVQKNKVETATNIRDTKKNELDTAKQDLSSI